MILKAPVDLLGTADVEIPCSAMTRSGVAFDPSLEVWKYIDGVNGVKLHFREVEAPVKLRQGLKLVLTWYAEHLSPSHLGNLFERFKHFASAVKLGEDEISSVHLINYRATLNGSTEWYLGSLSGLLKRWHRMRIPGVSRNAIKYLGTIRIKGNRKGVAVLTMDPDQGRFTDIELEAIRSAIGAAYKTGHIESDAYILAILFIALGPRPIQYAAMKVCDVQVLSNSSGNTSYIVSVPRAKRRVHAPVSRSGRSFQRSGRSFSNMPRRCGVDLSAFWTTQTKPHYFPRAKQLTTRRLDSNSIGQAIRCGIGSSTR